MGSGKYFESYIDELIEKCGSNVFFATNSKDSIPKHLENHKSRSQFFVRFEKENEANFQSRLLESIITYRITHILSIQYPRRISSKIIDCVNGQAFNLHLAPLPEFKGWNGAAHAILEDFPYYGPTLHWMTSGIDDGDICFTSYAPIQTNDTSYTILQGSRVRGRDLVTQLLNRFFENLEIPKVSQLTKGKFYVKNEIESFRIVQEVDDLELISRTARAFSVPGFPPALLEIKTGEFIEIKFTPKEF